MTCPKCSSDRVIEYYPVFSDDMKHALLEDGYSESQIQYIIELWENRQSPTGGMCLQCQHDWVEHTTPEQPQEFAFG